MLVVLVVNAPTTSNPSTVEDNARLVAEVRRQSRRSDAISSNPPMSLHQLDWADVLLIERREAPWCVPPKQGVGLARKVGSDVALALWEAGLVDEPWLYQTDCDVVLADDHFSRLVDGFPNADAVVFPFRHVADEDPAVADITFRIEAKLRYHVLGLQWANTPCAWHSLGSCLAVRASSYAQVRGFPRRAAGEDFHLLDKLNKLGGVASDWGQPIHIVARRSQRTPVGTGSAVERLFQQPRQMLDAPQCYLSLRNWMARLQAFIDTQNPQSLRPQQWQHFPALGDAVAEHLRSTRAIETLSDFARRTRERGDLQRRVHGWFGALECWRLIHAAGRDFPRVDAELALRTAPHCRGAIPGAPGESVDWQAWCERLAQLERERFAHGAGSE